jgi:hypothetical protein
MSNQGPEMEMRSAHSLNMVGTMPEAYSTFGAHKNGLSSFKIRIK